MSHITFSIIKGVLFLMLVCSLSGLSAQSPRMNTLPAEERDSVGTIQHGFVGIGVSSPSEMLDVGGRIKIHLMDSNATDHRFVVWSKNDSVLHFLNIDSLTCFIEKQRAANPSVFGTWVRDTTSAILRPAIKHDVVLIDSLPGDRAGITVNQKDSVIQDMSANSGTDLLFSANYLAFKFTAEQTATYRAVGINVKKSGTITNPEAHIQARIYTDAGNYPGSNFSYAWENIPYGIMNNEYSSHTIQVGQSGGLVSGNTYWLVLSRSAAPMGGGAIYIDSGNEGSGYCASSTDGVTWTLQDNARGWLKFYYQDFPAIRVNSINHYGIEANSISEYGIFASSYYDAGIRSMSTVSQGIVGQSTYGQGVWGKSNYSMGVQGISNSQIGVAGQSTSNFGVYGETNATGYACAGIKGYAEYSIGLIGSSKTLYGIQASSTNNYAQYSYTSNTTGVQWMYSNANGTNNLQRILLLSRFTPGNPQPGLGGSIDFSCKNEAGSNVTIGRIGFFAQNARVNEESGAIGVFVKPSYASTSQLAVLIDSAGRVGIGNPAPDHALQVNGNIKASGLFCGSVSQISDNDSIPDVSSCNTFLYSGVENPVVLTNLQNSVAGTFYLIVGTSDTNTVTIMDQSPFNLSEDWVGGKDDVIRLFCIEEDYFIEVTRVNN